MEYILFVPNNKRFDFWPIQGVPQFRDFWYQRQTLNVKNHKFRGPFFSVKPQIGSKKFLKSPFLANFNKISIFESWSAFIRFILTCFLSYLSQIGEIITKKSNNKCNLELHKRPYPVIFKVPLLPLLLSKNLQFLEFGIKFASGQFRLCLIFILFTNSKQWIQTNLQFSLIFKP